MDDEKQIIIKKVRKGGAHDHHGGAWKVAYADFVTAMMAFFLLMWLLSATSEEQKRGLSNYFGPVGELSGSGGRGGVLAGLTITSEGIMDNSVVSGDGRTDGDNFGKKGFTDSDVKDTKDSAADQEFPEEPSKTEGPATSLFNQTRPVPNLSDQENAVAQFEQENFKHVEESLKQAVQEDPELKKLAESLIIDRTPDGLRIQIVDQHQYSMFPIGDFEPYPHTRRLLALVAQIVEKLPNKISVTGHTDAVPFRNRGNYGNWELSTDRANASRRYLLSHGLSKNRITFVAGKAATEPLIVDNPTADQNRRISIMLHNMSGTQTNVNDTQSNTTRQADRSRVQPKIESNFGNYGNLLNNTTR